jgi:hypothetical protein
MQTKYFFSIAIACTSLFSVQAQKELPSESVQVIRDFDARLIETDRIALVPSQAALDTTIVKQRYNLQGKEIDITYPAPKIRPLAMKMDKEEESFNGFVKAGYGIPNSPLFQGYYHLNGEKWVWDFMTGHHSANNTKVRQNQRFGNTQIKTTGAYYFDNNIGISGTFDFYNNRNYFFGYDKEKQGNFEAPIVRQQFRNIGLSGKFFQKEIPSNNIITEGALDFYRLTDNFSVAEVGFNLNGKLGYYINDKHPLYLKVVTDFTRLDTNNRSQNLNNITLRPGFNYRGDIFQINTALNLISNQDRFFIYPDIEANVALAGGSINVFAGVNGDLQKNNLKTLSQYNPWINTRLNLRNSEFLKIFGGVKGEIQTLKYQLEASYTQTKNLPLYFLSPLFNNGRSVNGLPGTVIDARFDTANVVNFKGSASYSISEEFEITGLLSTSTFDMKNNKNAWLIPNVEANFGVRFRPNAGKLRIRSDVYMADGIKFLNRQGQEESLAGLLDLNLGADYQILKNFGVWIDANNLLNNKRQRWPDLPMFGINVLGGISFRF